MSTAESLGILQAIAGSLAEGAPVVVGTMFRSPGIRVDDKIVAFLGQDDRLIVKLPRARAVELRAASVVRDVTMGTRTMREWVSIPPGADEEATLAVWLPLAREALAYVQTL